MGWKKDAKLLIDLNWEMDWCTKKWINWLKCIKKTIYPYGTFGENVVKDTSERVGVLEKKVDLLLRELGKRYVPASECAEKCKDTLVSVKKKK